MCFLEVLTILSSLVSLGGVAFHFFNTQIIEGIICIFYYICHIAFLGVIIDFKKLQKKTKEIEDKLKELNEKEQ